MYTTENKKTFFVISWFGNEQADWVKKHPDNMYHIYLKDNGLLSDMLQDNITKIDNVGYNIYSYMKYIVDNYDNLPEVVVFCKNNVFPRHVSKEVFLEQSSRKVFTCIEEPSRWRLQYPITMLSSDNGFMELNTSWYTSHHPTKYFSNFNDFYKFIFECEEVPRYLRFAPGGNYVVPKQNILLRSKKFYLNLMNFVSHHQFSGESHMVERALYIIWNSTLKESIMMKTAINDKSLNQLAKSKKQEKNLAKKIAIKLYIKFAILTNLFVEKLFK